MKVTLSGGNTVIIRNLLGASLLIGTAVSVPAQFDSGSNTEDGALNVATDMTLTVQEDGVHNYTTIDVANGATLRFSPNSLNTPVIFLASGDVTIGHNRSQRPRCAPAEQLPPSGGIARE